MQHGHEMGQKKEFINQSTGIIYGESGWSDKLHYSGQDDPNTLKKNAEQGNVVAQLMLATFYFKGDQRSSEAAIKWLEKAVECDNFEAKVRLANCYFYGRGIKQDYTQAVKWLEKVTEHIFLGREHLHSHVQKEAQKNAQCQLAYCYFHGQGVEKSSVIAIDWLKKTAEQGYAPAQISLADCYFQGIGVEINDAKAIKWLEKAAGLFECPYTLHDRQIFTYNRNQLALRKLGFYYLREENYAEAIKWFEEATHLQTYPRYSPKGKEYISTQTELGICYHYAKNDNLAFYNFEE